MKKVLKSVLFIALIVAMLFCLTGCANINYEIKLNKDGSGEVSYVIGYDKNFITSMGVSKETVEEQESFKKMKEEAQQEGYTIESYEDDTTYGFKAAKTVKNIQEEFSIENTIQGESNTQNDDRILFEKSTLKTKFSQDAKMDLNLDDTTDAQEAAMMKALMGQMKFSYKITLPFKAGENNATTVSEDGKTLEWNLQVGSINEIKFVAEEDYTMIALGGLAVILVIIIIIAVLASKKGKKKPIVVKTVKPVEKVETKQEETIVKEETTTPEETVSEEVKEESVETKIEETPKEVETQETKKEDEENK